MKGARANWPLFALVCSLLTMLVMTGASTALATPKPGTPSPHQQIGRVTRVIPHIRHVIPRIAHGAPRVNRVTPNVKGKITEYAIPSGNTAYGITQGADGNLWFTEDSANQIGMLTPSGTFTEFAIPGICCYPTNITAGPDGNLWFSEYTANDIVRLTPSGTFTDYTIPTSNAYPWGITAGPDGNLWFTELAGNAIGSITPAGIITEYAIPTSDSHPYGIVAGPDGNLWFTEFSGNKVASITLAGTITEYAVLTANACPLGITQGVGMLWFTEYCANNIGSITSTGSITEYPIPSVSSTPYSIAQGTDGNLWFNAYNPNNIGFSTPGGMFTTYPLPHKHSGPWDITAGPTNDLWFTEEMASSIGSISASSSGCNQGSVSPGSTPQYHSSPVIGGTSRPNRTITIPAGNLLYHGGPELINTANVYAIFWEPTGSFVSPTYNSLIERYFCDVGSSPLYHNNIQYTNGKGKAPMSSSLGGSWVDTSAYPSGTLSDANIQAEANKAITKNGWSKSIHNNFFVFTAKSENICTSFGCSFSSWCAYHGAFGTTIYATMPYLGTSLNTCWTGGKSPNNDVDADAEINVTSHEQMEAATDPHLNAWYDSSGQEMGDKCAWTFGHVNSDGSNVTWNGHEYIVQQEWDNHTSSCVLSGP